MVKQTLIVASDELSKATTNFSASNTDILLNLDVPQRSTLKPPSIIVLWKTPSIFWTKADTDGSFTHASAACGGIFRNHYANHLGSFAARLELSSVLRTEVMAIMALEIAASKGWEGNCCADKLANEGHALNAYKWWESIPSCIRDDFLHDRLGLPSYRIA
ncbi:hypothetical protein TSUD_207570 [Trifolium subterraneum]|uniref:RNase H type-1 domain-containing protein n=1 Tax=Trifolium subterraneum TaxID=3900 RepID=A0A2Z6MZW0_TRISU|nr:hypothetical protein TSUD_207570 [Trifolium subterraneum]